MMEITQTPGSTDQPVETAVEVVAHSTYLVVVTVENSVVVEVLSQSPHASVLVVVAAGSAEVAGQSPHDSVLVVVAAGSAEVAGQSPHASVLVVVAAGSAEVAGQSPHASVLVVVALGSAEVAGQSPHDSVLVVVVAGSSTDAVAQSSQDSLTAASVVVGDAGPALLDHSAVEGGGAVVFQSPHASSRTWRRACICLWLAAETEPQSAAPAAAIVTALMLQIPVCLLYLFSCEITDQSPCCGFPPVALVQKRMPAE